jgi:phosphate transport system substrate-binding protein
MKRSTLRRGLAPAATVLTLSLALAACGGSDDSDSTSSDLTGSVRVDGSSTVAPLSSVAAELFAEEAPEVNVTVGTSGTGGGFEKFCNGETDANDASRPIKDSEKEACAANNVEFTELQVAVDALTVVVNTENTWAKCLTTEQLKKMWEPGSTVNNWNQVDPAFPDVKLELFGAGTDSGTFDYFTDVIVGEEGASRTDYNPSEDDNVTVTGVEGSKGGLGYFGFSYYEENADVLTAVEIDSGAGCVAPSVETAQDGTYTPLARPLFVYPSKASVTENAAVKAFFDFYVDNDAQIAEEAQFIPLNDEQRAKLESDWAAFSG